MHFNFAPLLLLAGLLPSPSACFGVPRSAGGGTAPELEQVPVILRQRHEAFRATRDLFNSLAEEIDNKYLHGEFELAKRARLLGKYVVTPLQPDPKVLQAEQRRNIKKLVENEFARDTVFIADKAVGFQTQATEMGGKLDVLKGHMDTAERVYLANKALLSKSETGVYGAYVPTEQDSSIVSSERGELQEMKTRYDHLVRTRETVLSIVPNIRTWFGEDNGWFTQRVPLDMAAYFRALVTERHYSTPKWRKFKEALFNGRYENWEPGVLLLKNGRAAALDRARSKNFVQHAVMEAKHEAFIEAVLAGAPDTPRNLLSAMALTCSGYISKPILEDEEFAAEVAKMSHLMQGEGKELHHGANEALKKGLGMKKDQKEVKRKATAIRGFKPARQASAPVAAQEDGPDLGGENVKENNVLETSNEQQH